MWLDFIFEQLQILLRWAHVIAAIMWIGDSFLFMWLDSHLSKSTKPREGDVVGELWMTHSGGFYEVIKKKSLLPTEMPHTLYWFKWESYTTWITGCLLFVVVYLTNGAMMLVNPAVLTLTHGQAIGLSVGLLIGGVIVYDLLCRTPLAHNIRIFSIVGFILLTGLSYGLWQLFSARGAFLLMGAMLGTIMTSNVFFRIIPAARALIDATKAGTTPDVSLGARAKMRSTHNHYLTLPVLFCMLSNHFPSTYGHKQGWIVLVLLMIFGLCVKIIMNQRSHTALPIWFLALLTFGSVAWMTSPTLHTTSHTPVIKKLSPHDVFPIVQQRCTPCHAEKPTQSGIMAPPKGLMLETVEQFTQSQALSLPQVKNHIMPLGNLTNMTDEERTKLLQYLEQSSASSAPKGTTP